MFRVYFHPHKYIHFKNNLAILLLLKSVIELSLLLVIFLQFIS